MYVYVCSTVSHTYHISCNGTHSESIIISVVILLVQCVSHMIREESIYIYVSRYSIVIQLSQRVTNHDTTIS